MNNYLCKICNEEIKSNSHFWENHKIKISEYFAKFENRLTIDGKQVEFKKEIESYFSTDFNNLQDMKTWLKSADPETRKEYLLDLLTKRKIKKNWKYAPGQILLRLSNIPSLLYYEKEFGISFSEICKKIGLKIKYKNKINKIDWVAPMEIIQDSREQKNLVFPKHIKTEVSCLKYGDYALKNNTKIVIERKSLSDAAGTLSAGFDRFKRELQRAKKDKGYIIILVESSFNDFRSVEYLPQTKHIKSSYAHLAKRARELYEEFDCFQLCFVPGRKEAARITEFILKTGKKIKNIDLQLAIDKKII